MPSSAMPPSTIEVCQFPRNVDLTVIYAIGRRDGIVRQVKEILEQGKRYAIIQVCLRSTMSPCTSDWIPLWENAQAVWSYYDLNQACVNDGLVPSFEAAIRFYHAPLGVDSNVFWVQQFSNREYIILSSGHNRLQESIRECYLAAEAVGMECANLGKEIRQPFVHSYSNIDDPTLRWLYNKCPLCQWTETDRGL